MSAISDRILEQWLQEIIQQSASTSTSSPLDNHHVPRPLPRNHRRREDESAPASSSNPASRPFVRFPEYDETMYRYHRNVADYQHIMLQMMECMESNQRRPVRQQTAMLDNMFYPYNRNMQEYNTIMRESLDILRELHQLPSAHVHNVFAPAHENERTHARTVPRTSSSSVQEFYSLLPLMRYLHIPEAHHRQVPIPVPQPLPVPPATRRLTPEQIQLSTRSYTYVAPAATTVTTPTPVIPVCAISLEEFRNGDSITQIQHCRHEFRTEYLNRWFQRDSRCPICRCNLWDVMYPSTQGTVPLVESDASLSLTGHGPRPLRLRAMSEPHVYRNNNNNHNSLPGSLDTGEVGSWGNPSLGEPFLLPLPLPARDTHSPPSVTSPSISMPETTNREIQQWLNTILSTRYPGFSNMDVDITYTVEYDLSMNPVSTSPHDV